MLLDKIVILLKPIKERLSLQFLRTMSDGKNGQKQLATLLSLTMITMPLNIMESFMRFSLKETETEPSFSFPNCGTAKDDIKFVSFFRGIIIKEHILR